MSTKKLTTHEKDLVIDDIIRNTNPITVLELCKRANRIEPQISDADVRRRVHYDVCDKKRAVILDALVSFKLDRMAKRRLKRT